MLTPKELLEVYISQRNDAVSGSAYYQTQCDFAYSSNHIEGSKLSPDQTRMLFDRAYFSGDAPLDDILETKNHFEAFDYILDSIDKALSHDYLFEMHSILKNGTSQQKNPVYSVGGYKLYENVVGDLTSTTPPEKVEKEMWSLLKAYENQPQCFESIVDFHAKFESIHPFSDGNGRVGRLIMFKECLRFNEIPFMIADEMKGFYIRGLKEYSNEKGFLMETCLHAQDAFKTTIVPLAESYLKAKRKFN